MDSMPNGPTIVSPNDESLTPYKRWTVELTYAEKELEKFRERGRRVLRRYLDERDAVSSADKWFNLFHANTNIMKSALYAKIPQPEVKRKWDDYQDDLARVAAQILQRAISPDKDDPRDTFDAVMMHAVEDRLLPGLGTAWLRLETDVEEAQLEVRGYYSADYGYSQPNMGFKTGAAPDEPQAQQAGLPQPEAPPQPPPQPSTPQGMPPGGPPGAQPPSPGAPPQAPQAGMPPPQPQPQPLPPPQIIKYNKITDQRVCIDYVFWEDFVWSPCRVWEERRWVARIVYMDRDELKKRFGAEVGEKIPLNYRPSSLGLSNSPPSMTPRNEAIKRAKVYEIWDRTKKQVLWLCRDHPELLDTKEDFLHLVGFEPCPNPMLANITTSNTVPRPDFYIVQDQYNELDTVNNRISLLVQACKVVGVYDRSSEGIQRMLQEGFDNTLIPVDNWAMFAEKGGVKGQVDWLPLEQVVNALQRLYEAREAIKAQIYELTGIADIIRGASKASETLGAQQIKAKFASIRIQDTQDEVATFASQLLRIKAEIMVKHFEPEILIRKSNILRTDDAQLAHEAMELLQSEEGFEWRITVTSDQLAQADYAMEKEDRIELLTTASGYMEKGAALIAQMPNAAPLVVGMLKWAVAGFRGARDIEGMLDKQLDALLKAPPAPPPPDPVQQKMQIDQNKAQLDMQTSQQKANLDAQSKQQEMAMKERMNQMELQMKRMELLFKAKELDMKAQQLEMEQQYKEADAIRQERTSIMEQVMNLQSNAAEHQQAQTFAQQEHDIAQRHAQQEHRMNMEQASQIGDQKVAQAKAQAKAVPKQPTKH